MNEIAEGRKQEIARLYWSMAKSGNDRWIASMLGERFTMTTDEVLACAKEFPKED